MLLSYKTNLYISIGASIEESSNEKCSLDQADKKYPNMIDTGAEFMTVTYCLFIFIENPLLGIFIPDIPLPLLEFIFIDAPLLGILIPGILN